MNKIEVALVDQVIELWTASERLWEAACEEDQEFQDAADKCEEAYAAAVQYLEEGDRNRAISALERAKSYEIEGGDDQHATAALALLEGSL